jgi:hypothetical protein
VKRRFVLQRHSLPDGTLHFDFMVERAPGEALLTWRLAGPLPAAGESVSGERASDHRAVYLDYEGEISGGRGSVAICLRGEVEDQAGDPASGPWRFQVSGAAGELALAAEGASVTITRVSA